MYLVYAQRILCCARNAHEFQLSCASIDFKFYLRQLVGAYNKTSAEQKINQRCVQVGGILSKATKVLTSARDDAYDALELDFFADFYREALTGVPTKRYDAEGEKEATYNVSRVDLTSVHTQAIASLLSRRLALQKQAVQQTAKKGFAALYRTGPRRTSKQPRKPFTVGWRRPRWSRSRLAISLLLALPNARVQDCQPAGPSG